MHAYGNERKTAQRIGRLLRLSPDQKATCHILCYENTIDEKWVEQALKTFDKSNIDDNNKMTILVFIFLRIFRIVIRVLECKQVCVLTHNLVA